MEVVSVATHAHGEEATRTALLDELDAEAAEDATAGDEG